MEIFKTYDKVYTYDYLSKKCKQVQLIRRKEFDACFWVADIEGVVLDIAEACLSFTPYDPINGGFSQERPVKVDANYLHEILKKLRIDKSIAIEFCHDQSGRVRIGVDPRNFKIFYSFKQCADILKNLL